MIKKVGKNLFVALTVFSLLLFYLPSTAQSAGPTPVRGKAELMNTDDYLNFNNTYNSNVTISDPDPGNGNLRTMDGWVWSVGLGWVDFGYGPVTVDYNTGELSGQAEVANTGAVVDFDSYNSNAAIDTTTGDFSGYGWSVDGGWIDFTNSGVYVDETAGPNNPTTTNGWSDSGKSTSISTGQWGNYGSPYFEWSGASDNADTSDYASGVAGYWIYFGSDNSADPTAAGAYQTTTNYTVSSDLTSGQTYYLRVVTQDERGNQSSAATIFTYPYETTAPNQPEYVNVSPAGCSTTNSFDFSWEEPADSDSGLSGYQYKVGSTGSIEDINDPSTTSISADSYQEGDNVFYLRSVDNAGNSSAWVTGVYCSVGVAQVVDGPEVEAGPSSINVSWSSSKQTTSYVKVYRGNQYVSEQGHTSYGLSHEVEVVGLKPEQDYRYKLTWTDSSGNLGESSWYETNTAKTPRVINLEAEVISPTKALVSFETNYLSSAKIEYGVGDYGQVINLSGSGSNFSYQLTGLTAGKDYQLGIKATTSDGAEYSAGKTFSTPPLPEISNLRFQPIEDAPSASVEVTWDTNVKTSSAISLTTNKGKSRSTSSTQLTKDHSLEVEGLLDQTDYSLLASGRDQYGNQATSDSQTFTTAKDSRPPKVTDVKLETSINGTGTDSKAQIVVNWQTDEPATSQVEYAQGVGGESYQSRTTQDSSLSKNHTVIISELDPQRSYHLRAISLDSADNRGLSSDNVVITGKAKESVLDIIINKLKETFGFLANIKETLGWE